MADRTLKIKVLSEKIVFLHLKSAAKVAIHRYIAAFL